MDTQYKCGYCGFFINSHCDNYLEHSCFDNIIKNTASTSGQEINLVANENNVLTLTLGSSNIITPSSAVQQGASSTAISEELLISLVYARRPLWDCRTPLRARTNLKIKQFWQEMADIIGGQCTIDILKKRWRQLRDDFMRAKRKVKIYVPSGSGADEVPQKPTYKFYDLMKFLDDDEEVRTISNVNLGPPSTSSQGPPSTPSQGPPSTPSQGPPSTPSQGPPSTSSQTAVISPSASPSPRQSTKRKRKRVSVSSEESADIQREILKTLKAPEAKPDGVDGFLVLIGEGLRRLPLRNRNRLQIKYLQMLEEEECALEIEK